MFQGQPHGSRSKTPPSRPILLTPYKHINPYPANVEKKVSS